MTIIVEKIQGEFYINGEIVRDELAYPREQRKILHDLKELLKKGYSIKSLIKTIK
jgi:hypothetical protein